MLIYAILDRWTDIGYFVAEQIKKRVRNELKIEEIGISKIILGPYHIVLVCLLDLQ
jgi:hypothetical protein